MFRSVFGREVRRINWTAAPLASGCSRLTHVSQISLIQQRAVRTSANFHIMNRHRNHNPRNNEGCLNKTIYFFTKCSRRGVVLTVGSIDKVFSTDFCDKFFRFSRKMVKGFWRWYDSFVCTKNVIWHCPTTGPRNYREQVNFNLTLDSMRGLPVITCMFIPGGFIILGLSLYLLPAWFVLPRTFWSRMDIQIFVKRQYTERAAAVPEIRNFLATLDENGKMNDGKSSVEVNLNTIPYKVLRSLASGHGFYLTTKMPISSVLRYRLRRYTANISKQDKLLKRDCLVHYLTQRELDWACYRRGFFPEKMMDYEDDSINISAQRAEQEKFLFEWIRNSAKMNPDKNATDILFSLMLSDPTMTCPKDVKSEKI